MSQLYVSGNFPSANYPVVLKEIIITKKKACSNSVISRWLGAYIAACQPVYAWAAKSLLKWSLSKEAYLNVLVFPCSSSFGHMYTEAGLRSHMSFFVSIYLVVFIALSALPLCPPRFHRRVGPLLIRYPTFGLCSFNKVAVSAGMASCSWWFQDS